MRVIGSRSERIAARGEEAVPPAELLRVVRKRLWVVALTAVVLTGFIVGFDLIRAPVYEASIKVLVRQHVPSGGPVDPGGLQGEVMGLQQLTQTVVEAADTRPVAEAVVRQLGLHTSPDNVLANLSATQVHDTQFVEVDYRDSDPRRAQLVADAVGKALSYQISEDSPSASAVTVKVWEQAQLPEDPVSPSPMRDGLVALVLGAMLGIALTFLLEHLDSGWHSPEELERISGVPNIGVIPKFKVPTDRVLRSKGGQR
jgi:non-specific protein-tyrosine kinase